MAALMKYAERSLAPVAVRGVFALIRLCATRGTNGVTDLICNYCQWECTKECGVRESDAQPKLESELNYSSFNGIKAHQVGTKMPCVVTSD